VEPDQILGGGIAGIDHGVQSGIVLKKSLDSEKLDDESGPNGLNSCFVVAGFKSWPVVVPWPVGSKRVLACGH